MASERRQTEQNGGNNFRELAEEFLDKQSREGRAEATLSKNRWLLEPNYAAFGTGRSVRSPRPPGLGNRARAMCGS